MGVWLCGSLMMNNDYLQYLMTYKRHLIFLCEDKFRSISAKGLIFTYSDYVMIREALGKETYGKN